MYLFIHVKMVLSNKYGNVFHVVYLNPFSYPICKRQTALLQKDFGFKSSCDNNFIKIKCFFDDKFR